MSNNQQINLELLNIRSCYDPILGYSKLDNEIPGYDLFPKRARIREADLKILVTGGSTSTWPIGNWSKLLGEKLVSQGVKPLIFNGAAQGYTSGQELLKIIRDAPSLSPDIIVSLSGVNDLAFMQNMPSHPLLNKYQNYVAQYFVNNAKVLESSSFGPPRKELPSDNWLRNSCLLRATGNELGIKVLSCLQPTTLFGDYKPNEEEEIFINQFRKKAVYDLPYEEEVEQFYTAVRASIREHSDKYAHVLDLSFLFAGKSGLFSDYRHQNMAGDELIADAILSDLLEKKWV